MAVDPVCKMMVDEKTAVYVSEYSGKNYYFCASGCKHSFDKDPESYLGGKHSSHGGHGKCCAH
jgi:YHS domain-containing protein